MNSTNAASASEQRKTLLLPAPQTSGSFPVEKALSIRRSFREYSDQAMTLNELAQLLWSCQGITSIEGFRTTPSGGAVFPLELYAFVKDVDGLAAGIYHYLPNLHKHEIELIRLGDFSQRIFDLSTKQDFIKAVPVNFVLTSFNHKMAEKYGDEFAERFVFMEMGHAVQNVHLQAEALELGSVAVGVVNEDEVKTLCDTESIPYYMVSIGKKK
jgi:SagB-type dehydrogenase family enzyme